MHDVMNRSTHAATDKAAREAIAAIDALAGELVADSRVDRTALIAALRAHAQYDEADPLWPHAGSAVGKALVVRLWNQLAQS